MNAHEMIKKLFDLSGIAYSDEAFVDSSAYEEHTVTVSDYKTVFRALNDDLLYVSVVLAEDFKGEDNLSLLKLLGKALCAIYLKNNVNLCISNEKLLFEELVNIQSISVDECYETISDFFNDADYLTSLIKEKNDKTFTSKYDFLGMLS